ncbi:sterol desaturase family protein [Halobacteriovorax marinus]|uniref:sterol desaturase family protein n=1 Tax=Halobacteriovorax marinus TaxID=97084 RepID=UPI003A91E988
MQTRFIVFISILATFSLLECLLKRRRDPNFYPSNIYRRLSNIALLMFGSLLLFLWNHFLPLVSAYRATDFGVGLIPWLGLSFEASVVLGLILMDLLIYFQHLLFHKIKILWKVHRVHHLDNLLDVTTALRFHPLELILSQLIKIAGVIAFGVSIESLLLFEITLSSFAIFNHANIQLPKKLDKFLASLFVTPNFHVIHHHPKLHLHNSNYGFCLSIWDRIFKTYESAKVEDYSEFDCGLDSEYRDSFKGMLSTPFRR